jgi:hypothetical protein
MELGDGKPLELTKNSHHATENCSLDQRKTVATLLDNEHFLLNIYAIAFALFHGSVMGVKNQNFFFAAEVDRK